MRVGENEFQSIDDLAARYRVSTQTIRRDVNSLCDRGLCRRRHGGVDVLPESENIAYSARRVLYREAKLRIARCLSDAVPEGSSLFFGIGTTPEQCARALADRAGLRVMTNNLNVAQVFSRNPTCEVTIAGGRLRNLDSDLIVGESYGFFARFAVDIGTYGVGGVAEDGGRLDPQPDLIVITGDLVDLGQPQEYAWLKTLLAPLHQPLVVIPGNHDEREAIRPRRWRLFPGQWPPALRH